MFSAVVTAFSKYTRDFGYLGLKGRGPKAQGLIAVEWEDIGTEERP